MWNIFAYNFINFFDYFYKKRIFNFLKKNHIKNFNIFFDVGAHKGESIKSFAKIFKIEEIYSFEPSPFNFNYLKANSIKYKNKYKIKKIVIENFALGKTKSLGKFNQSKESSSSTFKNINQKSKYFKKKAYFLI